MQVSVFWFRRDLRLYDNAGLYHALRSGHPILPVFIFDTEILDDLEEKADKRVHFIREALVAMQEQLNDWGSSLHVLYGKPGTCFEELMESYDIAGVYTNNDYEPYARKRDKEISSILKSKGIAFHSYKDQVIFEKDEVMKPDGSPYSVYTPYGRKWKQKLETFYYKPYPVNKYKDRFYQHKPMRIPSLASLGFKEADVDFEVPALDIHIARRYDKTRNFPAIWDGTTRLSVHLRFGTISIRQVVAQALDLNETLLNEFIWRDFFQMILWHMPHTATEACKKDYDRIKWRNNENEFLSWCNGTTGYPIVDAGMRELNTTGFMHNRVRMVTASFLVKHLLIDWRWGEAYFATKLLDYDMAANVGNWQWAAGCGCDAAPYFRIFNPYTQAKKFDPDNDYIRKWVPELDTAGYPPPITDHEEARERCLDAYKQALKK